MKPNAYDFNQRIDSCRKAHRAVVRGTGKNSASRPSAADVTAKIYVTNPRARQRNCIGTCPVTSDKKRCPGAYRFPLVQVGRSRRRATERLVARGSRLIRTTLRRPSEVHGNLDTQQKLHNIDCAILSACHTRTSPPGEHGHAQQRRLTGT